MGERTGWFPLYLTARGSDGGLLGAMVSYVKNNSFGEFIWDFAWAQAHEAFGRPYYPKLVTAVPFTPATGPKLLWDPRLTVGERGELERRLLNELRARAETLGLSSHHALFLTPEEFPAYEDTGFTLRHSFQYHWRNHGFATFEDFLKTMRSKRRREVVHERRKVAESGLKIARLTGDAIGPELAPLFYGFYADTVQKMGGSAYLTPAFFERVFGTMRENLLLVVAKDGDTPVAGALNFFGTRALYGRHWGCLEDYKFLHFEVCYYQGIEFAIERGFPLFEAGAQGEHKFNRGFLPSLTYSAHWIRDEKMRGLIVDHIGREKTQLKELFREYEEHTPFSRG